LERALKIIAITASKKTWKLLAFRVQLLKEYMRHSEFNTEPVLMTYPDNKAIENWIFS
jgi:hypothetical protein